jgi:hypothetical protein
MHRLEFGGFRGHSIAVQCRDKKEAFGRSAYSNTRVEHR